MRATKLFFLVISGVCLLAGCSGAGRDVGAESDDLSSTVHVPAGGSAQYALKATQAQDMALTIDCHPPADPDAVGPVLRVEASSLKAASHDPSPAGYWQQAVSVPAGQNAVTITSEGDAATCSVKAIPLTASQACRSWSAWRSPNTDHTHIQVGTSAPDWEKFPVSGNHWGAWAKWGVDYPKPVERGFLIHNLEHGGVVFSYKCSSADESSACRDAHDALASLAEALHEPRYIVTPDPSQPEMYGVRAWRMAYTSECLDEASALAFARANYRHGREDEDANPPIPFDPTNTDVPCQDLMAAPDSCN